MKIDIAEMLAEFHVSFYDQTFGDGSVQDSALRRSLHDEELSELIEAHAWLMAAFDAENLAAVARELADIVYIVYGTAFRLGIPLDEVITEVHRANMTKLGEDGRPIFREDGKLLKPRTFRAPDVAGVLATHQAN